MIAVVVVHFGEPDITIQCLNSVRLNAEHEHALIVVNNDNRNETVTLLRAFLETCPGSFLINNATNVGFAEACNQAIEIVIEDERLEACALLNNDAVAKHDWIAKMRKELQVSGPIGMVACRMSPLESSTGAAALGLVLYRSGLSTSRYSITDPLLGPCGGGAMYSAQLLREVRAKYGYIFDPDFFCYAEDTDLALRARALGYQCVLAYDAKLRHVGGYSSGGAESDFVIYYGLRNALYVALKNFPLGFVLRAAPKICLAQLAIICKYALSGRSQVLFRAYKAFFTSVPRLLEQRRKSREVGLLTCRNYLQISSPRVHNEKHMLSTVRDLLRRKG